jgi:pyruvate dehydrogenase E2 component (dihydrolipoamide acetyltransferase)
MPTAIIMPKAGMAMEQGVITRWHKQPGDAVAKGEVLLEIETDKLTMEVEAELAGTLLAVLYPNGTVVPVTETIAWIGTPGEAIPAAVAKNAVPIASAPATTAAPATASAAPAATQALAKDGKIPATPAAKRLARERGIDLAKVVPSGAAGQIRLRDIEAIAGIRVTPLARKLATEAGIDLAKVTGSGHAGKITAADIAAMPKRVPLTGMRKVIAQRMSQSRREIPDATLRISADVTKLVEFRAKLTAAGQKITFNDFILRATAIALSEFPFINATFENETILCHPDVNLGVAVSVDNGLLVPVLPKIQSLPLAGLSVLARETFEKARANKLLPDAYANGTFTVTNLGMYGIESFTPIINPPQTAILGVCTIEDRLALENGQVVVRKKMSLCLTHDHRVIDGALGARFLVRIKELLATPEAL